MQISEDALRSALRDMARQAEPAWFAAEPVIRKAARRRARVTAVAGCCALAVIATAVAVPYALRQASPGVSLSRDIGTGPWPTPFGCHHALPSTLPGSSGFGLKVSVISVTRTAGGAPAVFWTMIGTLPGNTGPALGQLSAVVLVVGDDGAVVAASSSQPTGSMQMPFTSMNVTASEIKRAGPRLSPCQPTDWATVWSDRARYSVVVLLSAWAEFPNFAPAKLPARYSVTAPLPLGLSEASAVRVQADAQPRVEGARVDVVH